MVGITLYHEEEEGWVNERCDTEAAFLRLDMQVEMFIEWPEVIVEICIIIKDFLEEYCNLIEKVLCDNVDAALLWLILLAKYLFNLCNLKKVSLTHEIFIRNMIMISCNL